jgi:hypothetical protein
MLVFSSPASSNEKNGEELLDQVLSLQLGMNGYFIGKELSAAQKAIGDKHLEAGAYNGTYKLKDGDLVVVVDKKTDKVLALYKQVQEADKKQLKAMVVQLMDIFAAPTTMAHEKILYWAYNKHGAISEEDFDKAREIKQIPSLGIIATVKLNSDFEITPDPKEKKDEKNMEPQKGSIYFIITSDPLVQQFMAKQN